MDNSFDASVGHETGLQQPYQTNNVSALLSLSTTLARSNRISEAEAGFRRAASLAPHLSAPHVGLGVLLGNQGKYREACEAFQIAVSVSPSSATAHSNLGMALWKLLRLEEATASLLTALELEPASIGICLSLGKLFHEQKNLDGSASYFHRATELDPNCADGYAGLGVARALQGKIEEAESNFFRAIAIDPKNGDAILGLGVLNHNKGLFDEAARLLNGLLELFPDSHQATFSRSIVHLVQGEWKLGWIGYESRWETEGFVRPTFNQPFWKGQPFPNQTVLLQCEQGLGDSIQFCRYASMVKERGGKVILECPKVLIPILKSCKGIDQWIPTGSSADFDFHAPLMSLPRIFGTMPANVPSQPAYLSAHSNRMHIWGQRFPRTTDFRVGIVWKGSPSNHSDYRRSIDLSQFEPLSRVRGIQLVSLQKGIGKEEIHVVADRFHVEDLGLGIDVEGGAFMDTAAIMKQLDLIISIDSAPAHLAGALGVPVWVPLAYSSDWRWLLNRDDTPWYPTMRLFRQTRLDDWPDVFERLNRSLSEVVDVEGKR